MKETIQTRGIAGLYSGCMALVSLLYLCLSPLICQVVGNASKAGVRFLTYDHFKHLLSDDRVRNFFYSYMTDFDPFEMQGKITAPRSLVGTVALVCL